MALKKKVSKAEFEKLPEHIKSEYIEDGDNYKLDLEGDEDTGALKRAKDREKQLRQETEAKLKEAEDRLADLEGSDARKKGDIATLEKAWAKKHDESKAEYEARVAKLTNHIQTQLVDNAASELAHKLSATAPKLLIPHIKARLKADFEGESPMTRVLDATGNVSAMTLDELQAEFVANKDFGAIITASKASGSGGSSNNYGGGAATQQSDQKPTDLSKASPAEIAARIKASKSA